MRRKCYGYEALRVSIDYGLRELGLVEVRVWTSSERKCGISATVGEPDQFGDILEWRFSREEWLNREHL